MQLTTQLAGARKQAVRLQAEVEAAQEAQRAALSAKQSELMQAHTRTRTRTRTRTLTLTLTLTLIKPTPKPITLA